MHKRNRTYCVIGKLPIQTILKEVKRQIVAPLQQAKRKTTKLNTILTSLASAGALIAALLAADTTMTGIKIKQAQDTIQTDVKWMRQIDQAMLNLRTYEDQARAMYQQGRPVNIDKFNTEKMQYQKEVADAYAGVNKVIGYNINESASLFNRFDQSVPNILEKGAPTDSTWRAYLIRNEFLIGLKVAQQQNIIQHEKQFIFTRFFEDAAYLLKNLF